MYVVGKEYILNIKHRKVESKRMENGKTYTTQTLIIRNLPQLCYITERRPAQRVFHTEIKTGIS